jgi:hypothetical protein
MFIQTTIVALGTHVSNTQPAPPPSVFNKYSNITEARLDSRTEISQTKPRILLWREELCLAIACKWVPGLFEDHYMVKLGAPLAMQNLCIYMPRSQTWDMHDITTLMRMHIAAIAFNNNGNCLNNDAGNGR